MEKRVLYGLVVILMCLVGNGFCQGEVQGEEVEWERLLMNAQQPILLTLTSSLCGVPCGIVEEQVNQLAKTYDNRIIFYKADILEKPFFSRLYKVVNVPTLIVFKGGKEIKRLDSGFYWGAVHDLLFNFKENIFYYVSSDDDSSDSSDDSPSPTLVKKLVIATK
ncbi:unnamed protein product [Eruca vesicaria subsp. sativa]|uniref:Thioredoxin domain-containing protein n=1 Tax=Eruca vesicaria subsp. sativa TaxID=29727 RepID=A0ABC8JF81_ERUVS|nr:unnamed protein product [Eruca vesicaria subsp. sativa]